MKRKIKPNYRLKKLTNSEINIYIIQYYTINPITGTKGWDIKTIEVYAKNYKQAIKELKENDELFDEIIYWYLVP